MERNDGSIFNAEVFEALVKNYAKPGDQEVVSARWKSLEGVEYFGLEINPNRPSVVFGFVELPQDMGGGLEFSTFWVVQEEGNPYSYGNALSDQFVDILFDGRSTKLPRWELDQTWEEVSLKDLMEQRGW
jgi:hypothetical protein